MRQRFDGIQALRGIACLMVVWHHLWVWETRFGVKTPLFRDIRWIGFLSADLFFVISGFILTHVHLADFGRVKAGPQFFLKRVWRIFPTYWVVMVLSALTLHPSLGLSPIDPELGQQWPHWVFLLPDGPSNAYAIPSWTLCYEMVFYAVFAIVLMLPARLGVGVLTVWAGAVIAALVAFGGQGPGALTVLSPYILEILGGCLIAALVNRGVTRGGFTAIVVSIAWLFAVGSAIRSNTINDWGEVMAAHRPRVLLCGPAALLIIYGVASLEVRNRLRIPRWMVRFGEASFSIYLTHFPLMTLCVVVGMEFTHTRTAHVTWLAGTMAAVLVFGFQFHRAVEMPLWNLMGRKRQLAAPQTESAQQPERRAA